MRGVTERLAAGLGVALTVLLAALAGLAALETFGWILLSKSLAAGGEIQQILLVWFALLGAAYAVALRLHPTVDLLARRLPAAPRAVVARAAHGAVALFGVLLAVHGARLAASVVNTLPATGWSASVEYVPLAVAGALMALFALEYAVRPLAED